MRRVDRKSITETGNVQLPARSKPVQTVAFGSDALGDRAGRSANHSYIHAASVTRNRAAKSKSHLPTGFWEARCPSYHPSGRAFFSAGRRQCARFAHIHSQARWSAATHPGGRCRCDNRPGYAGGLRALGSNRYGSNKHLQVSEAYSGQRAILESPLLARTPGSTQLGH